jgi:hypothetical protein
MDPILFEIVATIAVVAGIGSAIGVAIYHALAALVRWIFGRRIQTVWVVGQLKPDSEQRWELCGIYTTSPAAIGACIGSDYFIGQVPVNVAAPDEPTPFPNTKFPKGGES